MCGITGWVDFGRDLRTERDTIEAMTSTMICRGPDAAGDTLGGGSDDFGGKSSTTVAPVRGGGSDAGLVVARHSR